VSGSSTRRSATASRASGGCGCRPGWRCRSPTCSTAGPPEQPTLEELRARHGTGLGEDDLLILKALIPESDIAAMQAAGPVARDYPLLAPEIEEIRSLIKTVQSPYVRVSGERWALDLKR
jgi:hypothetical protein